MPDAIAAEHTYAGNDAQYFVLGPIPPTAFATSLYGLARSTAALPIYLSHVLTLQDAADAGAHAHGRRLLARSTTVLNTQPGYSIALVANGQAAWHMPLNLFLIGGATYILTYIQAGVGLGEIGLVLTVDWLNEDEYGRIYGLKPPVTVIGPPRPGVPGPPPAPAEPAVGPT